MIAHVITITVTETVESFNLEISTPESLRTIETIGILEMAKNQYIDSKHTTGPTIYQAPDTDTYDPRRGE